MKGPTRALYVAFVDLASAFDSIDRDRLWLKLLKHNVDKRLVYLIRQLHLKTSVKVKLGPSGSLTSEIPVKKGVKQGCTLAPLLFNLFINDVVQKLEGPEYTPPSIGLTKVSILLYADDMILISRTRIGLKRLLNNLGIYCKGEGLIINYSKTKVMVFRRKPKKFTWSILDKPIEQCSTYKYLGILFSETLSWKAHLAITRMMALKTMGAILNFFHTKGGSLIDPALKLFTSKVIPYLLYGVEIWGWRDQALDTIEKLQNLFMRRILALSKGTPVALMRAELGLPSMRARANLITLKYMSKTNLKSSDSFSQQSLTLLMNCEEFRAEQISLIKSRYVIPDDLLSSGDSGHDLRDWIYHMDAAIDKHTISLSKIAPWFKLFKNDHKRSPYLVNITSMPLRIAFTHLRFQAMPTALRFGQFSRTPRVQCLCICGTQEIEDLSHYILSCPLYTEPRIKFILRLIPKVPTMSEKEKLSFLLSDTDPYISSRLALYAIAARNIRDLLSKETMVPNYF